MDISYTYIDNAIDELVKLLGIKENVNVKELVEFINKAGIQKGIEAIAKLLSLSVKVNLIYSNDFESRSLVKKQSEEGRSESIFAQVLIPNDLPLYGTSSFKDISINVKVSDNCKNDVESFVAVIAHELSHIILHSLRYPKKDNEIYTDLVPIILGFSEIIKEGRKVTTVSRILNTERTNTITYGYLSDENFEFATNKIAKILDEMQSKANDVLCGIKGYKKVIVAYEENLFRLNEYKNKVIKTKKKMSKEDGRHLGKLYQCDYVDNLSNVLKINKEQFDVFLKRFKAISYYHQELLDRFNKEVEEKIKRLNNDKDLLIKDIDLMEKYIGFWDRIKIAIFDDAVINYFRRLLS